VEIPLREMFAAPTISQFAERIREREKKQEPVESEPIRPIARGTNKLAQLLGSLDRISKAELIELADKLRRESKVKG
jgi:hypothetical protein